MITKNIIWIQYTYVIVVKQIYDPHIWELTWLYHNHICVYWNTYMITLIWVFTVGIWCSYMCMTKHIYDFPYMSIDCWYMMIIYECAETHIWLLIYEYLMLVYDDHIWVFPHNPNRHMTLIYEYFSLVYDTHICVIIYSYMTVTYTHIWVFFNCIWHSYMCRVILIYD